MLYGTSMTPFVGLRREIDRLFDDVTSGSNGRMAWMPAVDVREDRSSLTLEFELPGLEPDQVEVTAENGVLTVRGEKRAERKEGDERRYHLVERTYGSFSRSFQLPSGVDEGQIDAQFENGVLHVRIPKAALPRPRKIEIQRGRANENTQSAVKGGNSQRAMTEGGDSQRSGTEGQRGSTSNGESSKREKREPATAGR
jgi:HSP20 family protein